MNSKIEAIWDELKAMEDLELVDAFFAVMTQIEKYPVLSRRGYIVIRDIPDELKTRKSAIFGECRKRGFHPRYCCK